MASTTTTALGTITGSWRPWISISFSFPSLVTLRWRRAMEGVGLMAALNTTAEPSLIPPKIPPAWLVIFFAFPCPSRQNPSLFALPAALAAASPSPTSKAFTAPMDMTALARQASNLSNTGSPTPAGRPRITHSATPPAESFSAMTFSRKLSASLAAAASGIYSRLFHISSRSNRSGSKAIGPMDFV